MTKKLDLFDAFGIELEYMLVNAHSLDVCPIADRVLAEMATNRSKNSSAHRGSKIASSDFSDVNLGPVCWSNELAAHVIELKVEQPSVDLVATVSQFDRAIKEAQPILRRNDTRLMPTAMHPWMDPTHQTVLWPHQNRDIYEAFDRVFDCRSHGWANVQSVHLNLPFDGQDSFARLHAAVRLVLPILPALSASSPFFDGKPGNRADCRLAFYANHCDAVPSLIGEVIPEAVFDENTYRQEIFTPIARDIRSLDPDGVFDVEFLNARGAIARFDRGSIEIRVMDVQETPRADVAICAAVIATLKRLVVETDCGMQMQQSFTVARLRSILDQTVVDAENAIITDADFLMAFGVNEKEITAGSLWNRLLEEVRHDDETLDELFEPLDLILRQGSLATRIRREVGSDVSPESLRDVYGRLADCLENGDSFVV